MRYLSPEVAAILYFVVFGVFLLIGLLLRQAAFIYLSTDRADRTELEEEGEENAI